MTITSIAIAVIGCLLIGCNSNKPNHVGTAPPQQAAKGEPPALSLQQRLQAVSPVFDSLAEALAKIGSKYPEMAGYQKEKANGQAEDAIWCGYSHNFTRPSTKRGVALSDFREKGFAVSLSCRAMPPPDQAYAMSEPALALKSLRFYVWAEVLPGPDPSPGLVDEINAIMRVHLMKLEEIEKTTF